MYKYIICLGKLINTIYDEFNQLYCADYNPIGTQFATAGKDKVVGNWYTTACMK